MPKDPGEFQVAWDGNGLSVEKISWGENGYLNIDLRSQKPPAGKYHFELTDQEGNLYFVDDLHISPRNTFYSEITKNFTGDEAVIVAITLLFLGLAVICIIQFFRLRGPLLYSYDAILACAIALFASVTSLLMLNILYRTLTLQDSYWMSDVYAVISQSGGIFMIFTSPLVIVFSVLMIISNIALLRHERFRIQNILGLGIGAVMILSEGIGFWLMMRSFSGSTQQLRLYYMVNSVICTVFTYFECILLSSVICGFRAAKHIPKRDKDYILILGCGFRKDGTLPPLLRGRVDKAVEFWKQEQAEGKNAILIPSGGQGANESMAEAEAMTRYLLDCGIPSEAIMPEDQSKNTYQNMEFSRGKICEREGLAPDTIDLGKKTAFVTTNYHVFRSGVWAGLADLSAEGLGSRTKWWFWPNAFVRECVGLFVNRLKQEILWLIILVLFFAFVSAQIV